MKVRTKYLGVQLFQFARAFGGVTMASIPSNQFETVFTKVEDDKAKCDNMLEDEERLLAVVVHSIPLPPTIQVKPLPQPRGQVQGRGELSERLPLLHRPIQRPPRLRSKFEKFCLSTFLLFCLFAFLLFGLYIYIISLGKDVYSDDLSVQWSL